MGSQGSSASEVAGLVRMPELLSALGFGVNTRTRRAPCILHGGSNASSFSWRDDGLWHCHSCGEGGGKITLVRAVRRCGFREAVEFLAALAGVEYRARHVSPQEIARLRARRERAEAAAWDVQDRFVRLQSGYARALRLVEKLQRAIGERLSREIPSERAERLWAMLARIAPVSGSLFAVWGYLGQADIPTRIRFALGSPAERRAMVFGEELSNESLAA